MWFYAIAIIISRWWSILLWKFKRINHIGSEQMCCAVPIYKFRIEVVSCYWPKIANPQYHLPTYELNGYLGSIKWNKRFEWAKAKRPHKIATLIKNDQQLLVLLLLLFETKRRRKLYGLSFFAIFHVAKRWQMQKSDKVYLVAFQVWLNIFIEWRNDLYGFTVWLNSPYHHALNVQKTLLPEKYGLILTFSLFALSFFCVATAAIASVSTRLDCSVCQNFSSYSTQSVV